MNRSTVILFVLLLALGAITYFLLPSGEERQSSYEAHGVSIAVDSASVTRIDIRRPLSLTTLQNVGGKWMVTAPYQYAADPAVVTQLIGGLAKFTVGSLVSSNPEKQRIFQVDSLGTVLTLTDRAGASQVLILGKMGPAFSEVYFRLPESKDVYLGEGIDSWMLTREPKEWRDKSIASTNTEAIRELVFTAGSVTASFIRDSAGWTSGDQRASIDQLNPSLTALMALKAEDFIDSAVEFKNRPLTMQVKGPDEFALSLYPLDADSSRYALQSSKSRQLFVVGKYTAGQLMKPVELLQARLAAAVPEKKRPRSAAAARKPVVAKTSPGKSPPAAVSKAAPLTKAPQQKSAPPPKKTVQPPASGRDAAQQAATTPPPPPRSTPPAALPKSTPGQAAAGAADDEGDLTVHTVKRGETMTTLSKKYNVTVDQIIRWNQLKSISVRPGQELYVFVRK